MESENDMELPRRGKNRHIDLMDFAQRLIEIDNETGFKVSSRGWCYQLEGLNVITKGDFNRVQSLINECRKNGMLPIDFVAEESARRFENVWIPTTGTPEENLIEWIQATLDAGDYHKPDYWENEKYYIQMLVEKVDLVSLFKPVCEEYNVCIATSKGWASISQRAEIAQRFKEMEDSGHIPVLLYAGDHDPFGLGISDFLMKNFIDIELGTGWNPRNCIIDRFGLNYDFIMKNKLSWIENLETGSGKNADASNPIVKRYVEQFGYRKVEANAIVVNPTAGRKLCRDSIESYLGTVALERFKDLKDKTIAEYEEVMNNANIFEPLTYALDLLSE
jgi:hypothetical protein